ncbi:HotDog domain-containing protein [Massariosphaeria phaeospora]|uniref:HotDog domain-containing protein n=1 Tax=Massariosphaeria phaeospora TaxID=100035 RepID=A0A7C8M8K5_9PLEO|nr:HotDog domain-containing protein [Massariosphaeria phaeospora]
MSTPGDANGASPVEAAIAHLSHTPWCAALLANPAWTPTPTASRTPKPTTEDSFFAVTLNTPRTIRACLTLRPTTPAPADPAFPHVMTLLDLGSALNGHAGIAHGGLVATLLDETCGVLITLNLEYKVARMRMREAGDLGAQAGMNGFTAYLNTRYKRPVPTPGVVLCRARFVRQEGRKMFVEATVEDGRGVEYAVGEGMFVEVKTKL